MRSAPSPHQLIAEDCRRQAARISLAADFIEARCGDFFCVCAHDDGHVHLYNGEQCMAEFGAEGWEVQYVHRGEERVGKWVDGVNLTFNRPVQHAFTPQLPAL